MKKLMLFSTVLLMVLNVYALSQIVDGVRWYYDTFTIPNSGGVAGARITSGITDKYSGELSIPSSLSGCPVMQIGDMAFQNCSELLSVRIPDGVTKVGSMAFYGCGALTSVSIPESVASIGEAAFYNCSALKVVTTLQGLGTTDINDGITSIEGRAFFGCSSLESVAIPKSVTSIGSSAFDGCRGLRTIIIHDGVTSIGQGAFRGCSSLESVSIPKSVVSIGQWAFADCAGLTSMTIPFVGEQRGDDGRFGHVFRQTETYNYTATLTGVMVATPQYHSATSYSYAYLPPRLRSVVITDETKIGKYAFSGCSGLTSVKIPESVTSIGEFAFKGCDGLGEGIVVVDDCVLNVNGICPNSVVIPQGVRLVADGLFSGCKSLKSVTTPSSLRRIGDYMFYACSNLTSVVMKPGVLSIGKYAFAECGIGEAAIPEGVTNIEECAFEWCLSLGSVTIPESVKQVGTCAFFGCSSLQSVLLPEDLTKIGAEAFSGCPCKIVVPLPEKPQIQISGIGGDANSGYVEISWSEVEGAASYNLYRSNDDSRHNTAPCGVGVTSPYRDNRVAPGITPGEKYYYWLDAVNCSGSTHSDLVFGVLPATLSISQLTNSYSSSGGSSSVSVSANTSWRASRNVSWITFLEGGDHGSGNGTLRYTVSANSSLSSRTGIITVTAAPNTSYPVTRTIMVVQNGVPPVVTASDGLYADFVRVSWSEAGDSTLCSLFRSTTASRPTTATWTDVTSPFDDTTAKAGVKYYYWVAAPSSPVSSYEKGYRAVSLSLSDSSESLPSDGGRVSVAVTANTSWNAVAYSDWVSLETTSGVGNGMLRYMVDENISENPRTTTIKVTAGLDTDYPMTQMINVKQIGKTDFTIIDGTLMEYHGIDNAAKVPANVTLIDKLAFEGSTGLTEITVEKGNAAYCAEDGVLYNKDKSVLIRCPQGRKAPISIPQSVKSIGPFAFSGCRFLTLITIPSSVTSIESSAFNGCIGLNSVTILTSAVSVGAKAFYGCSELAVVYLPQNTVGLYKTMLDNSNSGIDVDSLSFVELFADGGPYTETTQDGTTWSFRVKNGCAIIAPAAWGKPLYEPAISTKTTGEIVVPERLGNCPVTKLGRLAFCNCSNLTSVIIPFSVNALEGSAFNNCRSITSMAIPAGVMTIGDSAFAGCRGMTSISIPESVTNFGGYVFAYCNSLTSVKLPNNLQSVAYGAFYQCESLTSVEIPSSVKRIEETAFYRCCNLTSVAIPQSVACVELHAFSECSRLQEVVIPWCCYRIDEGAFSGCDELKVVYVDKGYVERIKTLYDWSSSVRFVEVVSPSVTGDSVAEVKGDPVNGYVIKPSIKNTAVEVSISPDLNAEKVTIELSTDVKSVKPNGATIKIVKGDEDITGYLEMPVIDGEGIIDLTNVTVKEEIAKEAMDVEQGAVIELDATNPSLTTPNTRKGLVYKLREGTTLEGMQDGDSTVGNGQSWTPTISVKGGHSAFYTISVEK